MVLSDRTIKEELAKGRIVIDPFDESCIQPASVDLRLGRKMRVFQPHRFPVIDVKQEMAHLTEVWQIDEVNPFVLHPGEFALGMILENIKIPDNIVGRLDGKSSLGRLGLVVHSTAGYVDPGWEGNLTLELSNVAPLPILLYYGMKVSQISFMYLTTPAEHPYGSLEIGSKYQGQQEPMASKYYMNYAQDRSYLARTQRSTRERSYPDHQTSLKRWLDNSQFMGSVNDFAQALGVATKTAEDWIYGRNKPGPSNRAKIFAITKLPEYATMLDGEELNQP